MADRETLAELHGEEMLFLDPPELFDSCIIGVCEVFGRETVVAYDREKVIQALMSEGIDREEAEEHFGFNIAGAYVGPYTPAFINIDTIELADETTVDEKKDEKNVDASIP